MKVQNEKGQNLTENEAERLLDRPENSLLLRLFIVFISCAFACNILAEVAYMSFQETFFQALKVRSSGVLISASEAAVVASITATAFTAARGLNIFVSMILSAGRLLLLHYLIVLTAVVGFFFTTHSSATAIKINSAIIGYGFSAIMPSMFAFIDRYAVVNDRRNAIFTVSFTLPNIFTPLLIGNLIESVPEVLLYLDGSVYFTALLIFLAVKLILIRKAKRNSKALSR